MPNLYITTSSTTTTVGIVPTRKTTPSLVVTCGSTTVGYANLTTCAAWATTPNKITVTSGSTTYYTMAPAKGTKFVNFLTPISQSIPSGTIRAACCSGLVAPSDNKVTYDRQLCFAKKISNSYCGVALNGLPSCSCYKLLSKCTCDDTSITVSKLISPTTTHSHNINVVFDDNFCYKTFTLHPKQKGAYLYCNYQVSPDWIFVGCSTSSSYGNAGVDYICVNGSDCIINKSEIKGIAYACGSAARDTGNTASVTNSFYGCPNSVAEYAGTGCYTASYAYDCSQSGSITHQHYSANGSSPFSICLCACMCIGHPWHWYCVNMRCYNNDIDRLPVGTMLFTNCPIGCFDGSKWLMCAKVNSVNPLMNVGNDTSTHYVSHCANFCGYRPFAGVYNELFRCTYATATRAVVSAIYTNPWSCTTAGANCAYYPMVNINHAHINHGCPTVYLSLSTYTNYGLNTVGPGYCIVKCA